MDERELNGEQTNGPVIENITSQLNGQQNEQVERKENLEPVAPAKEEKPQKSRRRVLLLLLLLIATGFLLATTTYAWFTSNRTVTVGDIDVNVATSGGIQISVDGANWKSLVTTAELNAANSTYATATNQIPATSSALQPVSSALASLTKDTSTHEDPSDATTPLLDKRNDDGYLSMWHGVVKSNESTGQYILTTSDISNVTHTTSSGYFVCFDLFFKVDAETSAETTGTQKQIYLTTASDVIANGSDSGIKNAARVAFIKEGATASDSATAAATAQALKTTTLSGNVVLWEPNYDKHTASGVNNAVNVYGVSSSNITAGTGNSALSYSGVIAKVVESDNIPLGSATAAAHSTQFAAVPPTGVTLFQTIEGWAAAQENTANEGKFKQIFTLGANQITKMKVYFWVEGQDVDCENNASGGAITLKLQFSLNDAED